MVVLHISYIESGMDESINARSIIAKVENFKYDVQSIRALEKELNDTTVEDLVITGIIELKDQIDTGEFLEFFL